MNEYFVSAHGGRDAGTSTGTFVIPNDLEIHFYSADGTCVTELPRSASIL